jgi:cytochrome c peroxidase
MADKTKLVALGKALFWDMQVGVDGKQACASCHFHAGADHRSIGQLNGNPLNHTLTATDFPFHSTVVVGSTGVFKRHFNDVVPGSAADDTTPLDDAFYLLNGEHIRRVTGRNAPSVVNAVFNVRNFWDGRAKDIFSVFTPFGDSDPNSNIVMESAGQLSPIKARVQNSALASQSVGPANNGTEMSSDSRTWPKLGKKMLSLMPLAKQKVDATDSVLGAYANASGTGLSSNYVSMIKGAFKPQYWSSLRMVDGSGHDIGAGAPSSTIQYSQMEYNFALFWGLAVQAYESTLVSDATPYDAFVSGSTSALSADAQAGMNLFNGKAKCSTCHVGAEFAGGTYSDVKTHGTTEGLSGGKVTDTGFFRTGVRPSADDGGLAGNDGFGKPLSLAVAANPSKAGVTGAFKTPTVRNVEFTGPYFHNGSAATLEQVVDFYSRGGDFASDPSLSANIVALNLSAAEKTQLVAFMKALSDDRVRYQKAPFDHPQLCVPNGAKTASGIVMAGLPVIEAMDNMVEIPAVGRAGGSALQTFAELVGASTASGARANTMDVACTMQ